ncbi:hypothetical protein HK096_002622, partial [Nowakowskiella sp. JEL0078]
MLSGTIAFQTESIFDYYLNSTVKYTEFVSLLSTFQPLQDKQCGSTLCLNFPISAIDQTVGTTSVLSTESQAFVLDEKSPMILAEGMVYNFRSVPIKALARNYSLQISSTGTTVVSSPIIDIVAKCGMSVVTPNHNASYVPQHDEAVNIFSKYGFMTPKCIAQGRFSNQFLEYLQPQVFATTAALQLDRNSSSDSLPHLAEQSQGNLAAVQAGDSILVIGGNSMWKIGIVSRFSQCRDTVIYVADFFSMWIQKTPEAIGRSDTVNATMATCIAPKKIISWQSANSTKITRSLNADSISQVYSCMKVQSNCTFVLTTRCLELNVETALYASASFNGLSMTQCVAGVQYSQQIHQLSSRNSSLLDPSLSSFIYNWKYIGSQTGGILQTYSMDVIMRSISLNEYNGWWWFPFVGTWSAFSGVSPDDWFSNKLVTLRDITVKSILIVVGVLYISIFLITIYFLRVCYKRNGSKQKVMSFDPTLLMLLDFRNQFNFESRNKTVFEKPLEFTTVIEPAESGDVFRIDRLNEKSRDNSKKIE